MAEAIGTRQHAGEAQHDRAELPALADRDHVLEAVSRVIAEAWASFDAPRPEEPDLPGALAERLRAPLPEAPGSTDEAVDDAAHVLDASVSPSRPLMLGYVGSSGLEVGVLGAALTATYDANLAASSGAAEHIEQQTLAWLAEFLGYGLGEGAFTSGGMTSNLTALLAARERAVPGGRARGLGGTRLAVYASEEAHHSVVRAVEVCGIGSDAIRRIAIDARHRMVPEALEEALTADVADGVVPVAVVATGGTTLTGAVDPLEALADVAGRHGTWLHVDGAYGLPAAATASAGPLFAGLSRADSVTVDAHKWLGVQKSCSAVLLREAGHLQAAFGHEERYMLHEGDLANPVDRTLEYSRPLRSLRLWMALRVHGAAQYRTWIEACLDNARRLRDRIEEDDAFELLHDPMLSTLCFRHVPAALAGDGAALDAHNARLAGAMERDGRVFLAPAEVGGRTCLRVCFVNFRTTHADVDRVLPVARAVARVLERA